MAASLSRLRPPPAERRSVAATSTARRAGGAHADWAHETRSGSHRPVQDRGSHELGCGREYHEYNPAGDAFTAACLETAARVLDTLARGSDAKLKIPAAAVAEARDVVEDRIQASARREHLKETGRLIRSAQNRPIRPKE